MSELGEKVRKSIERIRAFCPDEGYYLAFSGGKDSVVCKALLEMAGVKYDAHYRVTSVDPPELVRFIMDQHPDVEREVPRYSDGTPITMWNLIPKKKMPPTRLVRYCCRELKESGGVGRITVTGVRWAESVRRAQNQGTVTIIGGEAVKNLLRHDGVKQKPQGGVVLNNDNDEARRMVENCYRENKTMLNPIVDWADADVWAFIRLNGVAYCGLYDDGFCRLGCIGCPMAGRTTRGKAFLRWGTYKKMYIHAFDRMLEERERKGLKASGPTWKTAQDVFNWWMEYDTIPGQIDLFEEGSG